MRILVKAAVPWQSSAMVNTEALFRIGDAAQDEGNFALARQSFERGAALGDAECLCRLAYMFDIGRGVDTDKAAAMRFYQRAWRRGSTTAGMNIAILYRERRNSPAMFRWWKRVADTGRRERSVRDGKMLSERHRREAGRAGRASVPGCSYPLVIHNRGGARRGRSASRHSSPAQGLTSAFHPKRRLDGSSDESERAVRRRA